MGLYRPGGIPAWRGEKLSRMAYSAGITSWPVIIPIRTTPGTGLGPGMGGVMHEHRAAVHARFFCSS